VVAVVELQKDLPHLVILLELDLQVAVAVLEV
jgi:hypothetical protein